VIKLPTEPPDKGLRYVVVVSSDVQNHHPRASTRCRRSNRKNAPSELVVAIDARTNRIGRRRPKSGHAPLQPFPRRISDNREFLFAGSVAGLSSKSCGVSCGQWACFLRRSQNDHLGKLITVIQGGKVPLTAERLPAKYLVKEEAPKIISSSEQHQAYISRLLELQRKAHRSAEETETANCSSS
jgi:hypothetical protein